MSEHKLKLGFSPCPNDTFMFDAMVNGKIETEGLEFNVQLDDIETLNRLAIQNELDVSKISFAAFLNLTNHYQLLNSGSALGSGVGPLLIAKTQLEKSKINNLKIAVPGIHTTANFLFSIFFPEAKNKVEMVFSKIEDAVLSGKVDAGVIIHENRFTYQQKGLKKICDFGELWENETHQPVPLGGIAVKRNLPDDVKQKIDRVLRRSIEYAFSNPDSSYDYVKQHAQEIEEEVRRKHIALYVNEYSVDLGEKGKNAIDIFFSKAESAGLIDTQQNDIFVLLPANFVKA